MTPGDPTNKSPEQNPEDDDILDLDFEDVLDIAPSSDASSASAIEGVEMLDFLDDDEEEPANDAAEETDGGAAPLEMTIDMASPAAADSEAAADAEIDNLEELESIEVVDVEGDSAEEAVVEDVADDVDDVELAEVDEAEPEVVEDVIEEAEIEEATPPAAQEVVHDEKAASDAGDSVVDVSEMEEVDDTDVEDFLATAAGVEDSGEDMFAGIDTGEATVNHTREPTAITEAPSDAEEVSDVEDVEEAANVDETAEADEVETEFALRDEPEDVSAAPSIMPDSGNEAAKGDASFAAAVAPSSVAKRPKKKSALPMVVIALVLLLLVTGAGVGGLYLAGLLPGMGDDGPITQVPPDGDSPADGSPSDGTSPNGGDDVLQRLNAAEEKLLALYQTSRTGDRIDGAKLEEAQQILTDLETNDADVFANETIQQHKLRFDQLAQDFQKQERQNAKAEKARKFQEAYDFAAANAPKSLDEGALAEARKHANAEQMKLIEALVKEVADHQEEQARLAAAAQMEASKQAALDKIVAAVTEGDATQYREMLNAFVTDFPAAPETEQIQQVAAADFASFDLVVQWNILLTELSGMTLGEVTAEEAAMATDKAEKLLNAGAATFPNAGLVTNRLQALNDIARREKRLQDALLPLAQLFTSPANKSSFVFAVNDGQRYYTAEKPAKNGDNYVVQRFVDLEGKTEEIELNPADADRTATGATTVAATAQAVDAAMEKIEPSNVASPLWEAIAAVQADEKLDPVIKTQWLVALAEAAAKANPALTKAVAPLDKLRETGVDAAFNWADADAAAKVREACTAALAALPTVDEMKKQVEPEPTTDDTFQVTHRLEPIGVLTQGEDDAWRLRGIETLPNDGEVQVLVAQPEKFNLVGVGSLVDGAFALHEEADGKLLKTGRIVYVEISTQQEATPPAE